MREALLPWAFVAAAIVLVAGCDLTGDNSDLYRSLIDTQQQELDDYGATLDETQAKAAGVAKGLSDRLDAIEAKLADQAGVTAELAARVASLEKACVDGKPQPKTPTVLPSPKPVPIQMFFFTSDSCVNCPAYKEDLVKVLGPKGWKIGDRSDNHLVIVNTDLDPNLLSKWKINVWPTILVTGPDGKEAGRIEGVTDPIKVGSALREFQIRFIEKE